MSVTRSLINEAKKILCEKRYMVTTQFDSETGNYWDVSVVVDAVSEDQAEKKAVPKIEKLRGSSKWSHLGLDDEYETTVDETNKPLSYTDVEKSSAV